MKDYLHNPIAKRLLSKHGQFTRIKYGRMIKLRAEYKDSGLMIKKETEITARCGIEYDNRESVKIARISGELPAQNAGLSGREWIVNNYIMRSTKTDNLLFRFYAISTNSNRRVRSILMGASGIQELTREQVEVYALASETKDEVKEIFDVNLDNIVSVS